MFRLLPLIIYLRRRLGKKDILESDVTESNQVFQVIRHKYMFHLFPTELNIETPKGVYSSIWENNIKAVPYYPAIQKHILRHMSDCRTKRDVLVLGGAGCAIPRFVVGNYSQAQVVVIEYSQQLIRIAKRWFLKDLPMSRIQIIHDDAFQYVERENKSYDLVFIDLFNESTLASRLFERSFYEHVYRLLKADGLGYINIYGIAPTQLSLLKSLAAPLFDITHLCQPEYNYIFFRKK